MTPAGDGDDGDGEDDREGLTRRDLISGAAVLGVNAAAAGPLLGARAPLARAARRSPRARRAPAAEPQTVVPFYGPHQSGIVTPAQEYLNMAAFDLNDDSREQLRSLLERWTTAAAALTAGEPYEPEPQSPDRAPEDTGEAIGLGPAGLTLTFGFGPGLFAAQRARRLGSPDAGPRSCGCCLRSRASAWTRPAPAGTSACRRAPTTPR
jgi:deferrochelatase/peroxidase EfeB